MVVSLGIARIDVPRERSLFGAGGEKKTKSRLLSSGAGGAVSRHWRTLMRTQVTAVPASETESDCNDFLERLYQNHEWFGLRDAVNSGEGGAFHRGVVAGVFNR